MIIVGNAHSSRGGGGRVNTGCPPPTARRRKKKKKIFSTPYSPSPSGNRPREQTVKSGRPGDSFNRRALMGRAYLLAATESARVHRPSHPPPMGPRVSLNRHPAGPRYEKIPTAGPRLSLHAGHLCWPPVVVVKMSEAGVRTGVILSLFLVYRVRCWTNGIVKKKEKYIFGTIDWISRREKCGAPGTLIE